MQTCCHTLLQNLNKHCSVKYIKSYGELQYKTGHLKPLLNAMIHLLCKKVFVRLGNINLNASAEMTYWEEK